MYIFISNIPDNFLLYHIYKNNLPVGISYLIPINCSYITSLLNLAGLTFLFLNVKKVKKLSGTPLELGQNFSVPSVS